MSVWAEFLNNPTGRRVGDCAVRAISVALDVDWETAYALLASKGFQMGDVLNANSVWGAVLRERGFIRGSIPNTCPDCYTAENFVNDHPRGIYVLAFGDHVATARDGYLYDSWDSSQECPQYYWTKEEEVNGAL